jgi:alpha-D-ribose 1-methylphosphonate 5-triphosphate synthase subunit PhnH
MANPGQLVTIDASPCAPAVFNPASAATCLTLLTDDTPVWTDLSWQNPAVSWLQLGCGSSVITEPCMANFAIVTQPATMPHLDCFRIARFEHSEKATTVVVQVDDILPDDDGKYSDFSIDDSNQLELKGVPDSFWEQWHQLSLKYPLGIDIFFTCEDVLTSLPRVIRTEN